MDTDGIRTRLSYVARFFVAYIGSAVCLLLSTMFIVMADARLMTGRFALPFSVNGAALAGLGYVALAALVVTTALLTMTTALLALLKRESLIAYLVICGILPLFLLVLPTTDGNVAVLAGSAMITGVFWWFCFRRYKRCETAGGNAAGIAWLALLFGMIAFGGMYWSEYRAEQDARAERESRGVEPAPLGGIVLGRVALLYDFRGRLYAFDLPTGKWQLFLKDGVIDVKTAGDGSAWILSASPLADDLEYNTALPPGSFTMSRYRAGKIEALQPVEFGPNERPLMIAMREREPVVIGRKAAFRYDADRSGWFKVAFDHAISDQLRGSDGTALISNDGLTAFVGVNLGEWGGGLATVDLKSGKLNRIEKGGTDLCDGPLNRDCDPVTGIVPDPDNARCVLASIGLSHLLMHGRVIRVCPEGVSVELSRPLERPSQIIERSIRDAVSGHSEETRNTEAFFALIETRDGSIWAISPFAAYRRDGPSWSRHTLPQLEERGSLGVSEKLPGIVLLSSWRNARNSLSGPTPMALPAN